MRLAGFLLILGIGAALPAAVPAQDFLGAFLQAQQDANIRAAQQRGIDARRNGAASAPKPAPAPKVSRQVIAACQEKARGILRPQYQKRLAAGGEAAANAWLSQAAAAEGRRMGARVAAGQPC